MPRVQYGNRTIEYTFLEKESLKSHYITVQKGEGIVLKGKAITEEHAQKLILKKAKWILDKVDLVKSIGDEDIVTGARIQYLGRKYYVEIFINDNIEEVKIDFTESKFKVSLPGKMDNQANMINAFELFFKQKAEEKIAPRVKKWSRTTELNYNNLKFVKLDKRWGSCTPGNNLVINTEAVKLPFSLIDYLIVHELVHTKIKNHSKEFWAELSKHIPNWKELDNQMYGMKL